MSRSPRSRRRQARGASSRRFSWPWSLNLAALPGPRTRLHLRVRGRTDPSWVTAVYVATIIPADYVMARGMLRGLRRRAELGHH